MEQVFQDGCQEQLCEAENQVGRIGIEKVDEVTVHQDTENLTPELIQEGSPDLTNRADV